MSAHPHVQATLIELSDPRRANGKPIPEMLSSRDWQELFTLASAHGVLGILLHNLGAHPGVPQELRCLADRRWRSEWALTLRLRQLGRQLLEAMAASKVPAAIFKGTDFADHLYPHATLRPARDIDLLVPQEHWPVAGAVLHELGYEQQEELSKRHEATEYGEQCWRLLSDDRISAELHWNLIRNPSLRRRASICFHDLNQVAIGVDDGEPTCFSPASRMIIATVHATFIHQFDRLLLLCDIREAARAIATEDDVAELHDLARNTQTAAAIDVALGVTHRLLGSSETNELRNKLGYRPQGRLSTRLVSHEMVLYPPRKLSSFRRVLMREWLKRAA